MEKEGELFSEIAEKAEKDVLTDRRKRHKKQSDIVNGRKLGRYLGSREKEKKAEELKKRRQEILNQK